MLQTLSRSKSLRIYHAQTKFGEGNVFKSICLFMGVRVGIQMHHWIGYMVGHPTPLWDTLPPATAIWW